MDLCRPDRENWFTRIKADQEHKKINLFFVIILVGCKGANNMVYVKQLFILKFNLQNKYSCQLVFCTLFGVFLKLSFFCKELQ